MIKCVATIRGVSPYSQSRPFRIPKQTGEAHDAYEQRTWRERLHANGNDEVFIPPSSIKNCLSEVAKYLSETVPGKGKATYTKHFEAGILVIDPIPLGIKAADVEGEELFVPSDGKRGGGQRVWKTFPIINKWQGVVEIFVVDPILIDKPEKVREYLDFAGKFIGLGRFRPRRNGHYGRFEVVDFQVEK